MFYDVLDALEKALSQGDPGALVLWFRPVGLNGVLSEISHLAERDSPSVENTQSH
jgi:hypothetical protein